MEAGDVAAARVVNESILAQHPRHPGALIQRSRLESRDDNYRLALDSAKAAFEAGINQKWQYLTLLRRLRSFNLNAQFRELVRRMPEEFAADAEIGTLVARLFGSLNDPASALEFANKAAAAHPQSADLQAAI